MRRRHFLGRLLGIAGTAGGLGTTRALSARERLLIQESPVAGFQYHAGESVWHRLVVGDVIGLERQPGNRYDNQAVAVYWRDRQLGYLPRVENTAVAQMLDRRVSLRASIVGLRESTNPWARVRIRVEGER